MTDRPNSALPDGTRIGRTALRVSDFDETTAFYREVVGLDVVHQSGDRAILGAADTPLLVLEQDGDAPARHRSAAGLYHNAFRVPTRAALGDALERVRTHWQLDGASDHDVSEALYLTDPEGNGVEIYRDFPRGEWPTTDDGRVRMDTYSLDLDAVTAAATGESGVPAETDVGHVHLEVTSLEEFHEFYVETIGFEAQANLPGASFVSAGGYHHHVGANTWNHRSEPASGRGLSWFEVVLPDSQDVEALSDRLADGPFAIADVESGIAVTGPDGIEIRFRTGL